MRQTLLILGLALGWTAVTGTLTVPNLLLGALIGAIALLLLRDRLGGPKVLLRLWRIVALALLFVRELLLSASKSSGRLGN